MRIALLTLASCLLFAAPAAATTVSLTSSYVDGYKGSGYTQDTVAVTGDPLEVHDVRLLIGRSGVEVTDASAPVRAGAGCVAQGEAVVCARVSESILATVAGGEGDDRVTLVGDGYVTAGGGPGDDVLSAQGGVYAILNGGPGADRLTGGSVSSTLDGGPGSDVEIGGPADDWAMEGDDDGSTDRIDLGGGDQDELLYRGRHQPITVDLQAGIAGAPGEGDVLAPGIDWVEGGEGHNVLLGTDADEILFAAGAGRGAFIDGRGGADTISGTTSADILAGGAGNDTIMTFGGVDRIDLGDGDDFVSLDESGRQPPAVVCGAGQDSVLAGRGRPAIGVDCDTVVFGGETISMTTNATAVTLGISGATDIYVKDCGLRVRLGGRSRSARVRQGRPARLTVRAERGLLPAPLSVRASDRCPRGAPARWRKLKVMDLIQTLPSPAGTVGSGGRVDSEQGPCAGGQPALVVGAVRCIGLARSSEGVV